MNLWIVQGNLTRDPKQLETKGETCIASLSVAVNSKFKNKTTGERDVDFLQFKAFGKAAEFILTYLTKGQNVTITARVKNNNYEKDGQKVYQDDYIIEDIQSNGKREATNEG